MNAFLAHPTSRRHVLAFLGSVGAAAATGSLLAACGGNTTVATTASVVTSAPAAGTSSRAATSAPQVTSVAAAPTTSALSSSAVAATGSATSSSTVRSSAAGTPTTSAAASTTGAGASSAAVPATSAPASAGAPVTFLHWWSAALGKDFPTYMNWAYDEYKKRTGATVTPIDSDFGGTKDKLIAGTAAGTPPDASFSSVIWGRDWYDQGILADLDSYIARSPDVQDDQFFEATKQFRQAGGHTFGIPVMGPESQCLAINQDLYQAAGLDPQGKDIKTWDDLVRVGQKLTKAGDAGKLAVAGLAMPDSPGIPWLTPFVSSTGKALYDQEQNKAFFSQPETEAALQFLVDLANKNGISPSLADKGRASGEPALVGGQAATIFDETGMVSFPKIVQAPNLKWWMVPVPQGPGGKGPATSTWTNFTVIPKESKHVAEAFQWLRFFCGLDAATQRATVLKSDSPRLDFYNSSPWKSLVQGQAPQQLIPEIAKLPGTYAFHHYTEQSQQIQPLLQKAYTGQMDVKTALGEAQRLADTIFAAH